MPYPYLPYSIPHYSPVPNPVDVPPITSATEAPLVCLQISEHLIPYIIGAVSLYEWRDKWRGTDTQINTAVGVMNDLVAILARGSNCPDCPEEPMPAVFRLTETCVMQYSNDNGSTWFDIPGWIDFAAICFKGEQGEQGEQGEPGAPGAPGAPGEPGAPGDDCDCGTVPPQPPIPSDPVPIDRDGQACAIAMGMGGWMHGFFDDSLEVIVAGVQAAKILSGIVGDLIDAFPVIGALVDAVVNFAENVLLTGAQETLAANGNYFKEMIQCELYCIMKCDEDDFTLEYFEQVKQELINWGVALPPQTPLLVIIGQIFAAWLATIPAQELLRRANIYKDDTANCSLCDCEECENEPCPEEYRDWLTISAPTVEGWSGINGMVDTSGWTGDTTEIGSVQFAATRSGSDRWLMTAPAGTTKGIGVKRVFDPPCTVERIFGTGTKNHTGRVRRIAVVKRYYDGVYQVVSNVNSTGIVNTVFNSGGNFDPALLISEAWFLYISERGSGGLTMTISTSQINTD